MKFNAFDQITPSLEATKRLLFPIKFHSWLKLGLVSLLAGGAGMGFNNSSFSGGHGSEGASKAGDIASGLGNIWIILLPILLLVLILGVAWTYITSVFSFILLETLDKRRVEITKGWRRNSSLGLSYFLLRVTIGLVLLGAIILALLPVLILALLQGFGNYFASFSLWNLMWIIPVALLLVCLLVLIALFASLVYNFSIVHMYFTRLPAWASVKATFARMRAAKLAILLFLLARFVIGIVIAMAGVLLFILLAIPFLILALPFIALFWALVVALGWSLPIILAILIVGIAYGLLYVYTFSVLFLPLSVFSRYFSIKNYHALMK